MRSEAASSGEQVYEKARQAKTRNTAAEAVIAEGIAEGQTLFPWMSLSKYVAVDVETTSAYSCSVPYLLLLACKMTSFRRHQTRSLNLLSMRSQ